MNEITDEINKTMHVVKSLNNDIFTKKIETIVKMYIRDEEKNTVLSRI